MLKSAPRSTAAHGRSGRREQVRMEVRLASPDEADQLWLVRNKAIRHGCRNVYDEKTLIAWTPDQMPAGYPKAVAHNPFFVIDDPISQLAVATGFLDLSSGSVEAIFTLP